MILSHPGLKIANSLFNLQSNLFISVARTPDRLKQTVIETVFVLIRLFQPEKCRFCTTDTHMEVRWIVLKCVLFLTRRPNKPPSVCRIKTYFGIYWVFLGHHCFLALFGSDRPLGLFHRRHSALLLALTSLRCQPIRRRDECWNRLKIRELIMCELRVFDPTHPKE